MKFADVFMYILGAIVVLGFMALLGILIFKGVPQENSELLYLAIGALIGFAGAVVNYFYGSSKGSDKKTDIMVNGNKPK